LTDPNWNVVAVSNASGSILERYNYNAFGKRNVFGSGFALKASSDYNWNRAFTGQVLDRETGLMLYRNRYYHVELGRFISIDPIVYNAGDINLFRMIFNRILNGTDYWGLQYEGLGCFGVDPYNCQENAYLAVCQNIPQPPSSPQKCFDLNECLAEAQRNRDEMIKFAFTMCSIMFAFASTDKIVVGGIGKIAKKCGMDEWNAQVLGGLGIASLGVSVCLKVVSEAAEIDYQLAIKNCYDKANVEIDKKKKCCNQ
jgi:RHS repeat-associated protein